MKIVLGILSMLFGVFLVVRIIRKPMEQSPSLSNTRLLLGAVLFIIIGLILLMSYE